MSVLNLNMLYLVFHLFIHQLVWLHDSRDDWCHVCRDKIFIILFVVKYKILEIFTTD